MTCHLIVMTLVTLIELCALVVLPLNPTCNAVPQIQTKHSCYWFHRVGSAVDDSKHCCQHSSKKCHCQEQQAADPDPCIYELLVRWACNMTMVSNWHGWYSVAMFTWTVQCCHSLVLFELPLIGGHGWTACPVTRSCSSCWRSLSSVWQDMRHTLSDQRQDTATDVAHVTPQIHEDAA